MARNLLQQSEEMEKSVERREKASEQKPKETGSNRSSEENIQKPDQCHGCLEKERMGLLQIKGFIYYNVDYESRYRLDSWVDDRAANCCAWEFVKCHPLTGHVAELSLCCWEPLSNWFLNNSLFLPFEQLRSLDLSSSGFYGLVEDKGISSLKKLEILDLSQNNLNNSIFTSISGLKWLRVLKLNDNNLEDFVNLRNLDVLDLSNNLLNGSLSSLGLREMKNLGELGLSRNKFSGNFPECLSNLSKLRILDLTDNMLSGNFPSFIVNLTLLEYLSLFENDIEGSFSLGTLANHTKLEVLHFPSRSSSLQVETENPQWHPTFQLKSLVLRQCNLNMKIGRTIPYFLSFQNELRYIDLSHNNMVGLFPGWLMHNNLGLEGLILRNNSLVGNINLSSQMPNIWLLDVSINNISGLLPKDIGLFLPNITYLDLSLNSFKGNIPSSIGKLNQLRSLDLSFNHFGGELPEQLATNCTSLVNLNLSNNFLQGQVIPKSSRWTELEILYLDNNNFSGEIEDKLGNITSLFIIDMSSNSISGQIPSSIGNISFLSVLFMEKNQLEGQIPNRFSDLEHLEILDLSHNKLSGFEPGLNLSSLRFLYLEKNALTALKVYKEAQVQAYEQVFTKARVELRDDSFLGSYTDDSIKVEVEFRTKSNYYSYGGEILGTMTGLDLSSNELIGIIPPQIGNHQTIRALNLSHNFFSGNTPPSPMLQYDEGESKEGAIDMVAFSWSFAGLCIALVFNGIWLGSV
ncbi:hypothetical protein L6164_028458 [Bauhinia variegata]|uniref:Uncharacterized protein n=1 Tax=Bauhinia variegata TaxID=167791 RepID=A0ACB9L6R8_BAUVA|nr:hypothetical protein L6164_028458 [Bauhinia variegata]